MALTRRAGLGATSIGVVLCSISCGGSTGSALPTPSSKSSADIASCTGDIILNTSAGARTQFRPLGTVSVVLRTGEGLALEAPGPCGSDVGGTLQRKGVLEVVGTGVATHFKALAPGTVKLLVSYPACDVGTTISPGTQCQGGIAGGTVVVTVRK